MASAAALVSAGWSLCPVALLLGHPCPGCGLGRATLALLNGDVRGAALLHPLVFVALPGLAAASARAATPRRLAGPRLDAWLACLAALLLVALLTVWIARFFGALGGPVSVHGPVWRS